MSEFDNNLFNYAIGCGIMIASTLGIVISFFGTYFTILLLELMFIIGLGYFALGLTREISKRKEDRE